MFKLASMMLMGLLFFSCAGGRKGSLQDSSNDPAIIGKNIVMPAWFWRTPHIEGVKLGVGYALPYADEQTSFDSAFEDAAWRMFIDKHFRVVGAEAQSRAGTETISFGNTFKFEADTSGYQTFKKNLTPVDSFKTSKIVVMLAATDEITVEKDLASSPPLPDPADFVEPGKYVGVGAAPGYFYEVSSWNEAERLARIDAAKSIFSQVKGLDLNINDLGLNAIQLETDVTLMVDQTIRRIYDPVTEQRWVFVSAQRIK